MRSENAESSLSTMNLPINCERRKNFSLYWILHSSYYSVITRSMYNYNQTKESCRPINLKGAEVPIQFIKKNSSYITMWPLINNRSKKTSNGRGWWDDSVVITRKRGSAFSSICRHAVDSNDFIGRGFLSYFSVLTPFLHFFLAYLKTLFIHRQQSPPCVKKDFVYSPLLTWWRARFLDVTSC